MSQGDALARGAKKASFPATSNPKSLSDKDYNQRVGAPERCAEALQSEPEPLQSHVDNSALFAKKEPAISYKGEPLGDMVLIRRIEKQSDSSIIIPDNAKAKSDMGIVAGVGEGAIDITLGKRTPLNVKEGDLVLFDKFASIGMEVTLNTDGEEREHLILREHDILLKLKEIKPALLTQ